MMHFAAPSPRRSDSSSSTSTANAQSSAMQRYCASWRDSRPTHGYAGWCYHNTDLRTVFLSTLNTLNSILPQMVGDGTTNPDL
mmetsp:Transcript_15945/g.32665  ORF Transcript_15945/g.32665 Transcript_15945/m.32665 type:complete len:83 (-) Transcript_15945:232-480(-)